jgi:hypothetical protein
MKLVNDSKRMVILTLPHDEVCGDKCYCTERKHLQGVHDRTTGAIGVREVSLLVPVSLYIPAGATTDELPDVFGDARAVKTNSDLRKVD